MTAFLNQLHDIIFMIVTAVITTAMFAGAALSVSSPFWLMVWWQYSKHVKAKEVEARAKEDAQEWRWEYQFVKMPHAGGTFDDLAKQLNEYGADGWEICATEYGCWVMKRWALA